MAMKRYAALFCDCVFEQVQAQYIVARMRADADIALDELEARLMSAMSHTANSAPQLAHALRSHSRTSLFEPPRAHPHMKPRTLAHVMSVLPAPPAHLSPSLWHAQLARPYNEPCASAYDQQHSSASCYFGEQWELGGGGRQWEAGRDEWGEMAGRVGGMGRGNTNHVDVDESLDPLSQTISFGQLIEWFPTGTDLVYDSLCAESGRSGAGSGGTAVEGGGGAGSFSASTQGETTGVFGGRVVSSGYAPVKLASMAEQVRCFHVQVELVGVVGSSVGVVTVCLALPCWSGRRRLEDMPIRPLCDPAERARLVERGRRYVSLASGHHHVEYEAMSFLPSMSAAGVGAMGVGVGVGVGAATKRRGVGGRCMVDQSAYISSSMDSQRFVEAEHGEVDVNGMACAPSAWGFLWEMVRAIVESDMAGRGVGKEVLLVRKGWRLERIAPVESVAAHLEEGGGGLHGGGGMWQAAPAVWAYSLKVRGWGWTLMEGVRSIRWQENALDCLVIPPEHKEVLSALLPPYFAQTASAVVPSRPQPKALGADAAVVILLTGPREGLRVSFLGLLLDIVGRF